MPSCSVAHAPPSIVGPCGLLPAKLSCHLLQSCAPASPGASPLGSLLYPASHPVGAARHPPGASLTVRSPACSLLPPRDPPRETSPLRVERGAPDPCPPTHPCGGLRAAGGDRRPVPGSARPPRPSHPTGTYAAKLSRLASSNKCRRLTAPSRCVGSVAAASGQWPPCRRLPLCALGGREESAKRTRKRERARRGRTQVIPSSSGRPQVLAA